MSDEQNPEESLEDELEHARDILGDAVVTLQLFDKYQTDDAPPTLHYSIEKADVEKLKRLKRRILAYLQESQDAH